MMMTGVARLPISALSLLCFLELTRVLDEREGWGAGVEVLVQFSCLSRA